MNAYKIGARCAHPLRSSLKGNRGRLIAFLFLNSILTGAAPLIAQEGGSEIYNLSPFEISTVGEKGYSSTDAIGATRVATNILEIDHSIISLNKELISDIGAVDLSGALVYVSGVGKSSSTENDSITLRGIEGAASFFDGLPNSVRPGNAKYPTTGIERIEVIKGPAGALYGAVSGNGLVNYTMKRPTPESMTSFKATIGSFNDITAEVDVGGRSEKSGIGYRVAAAFRDGERKEGLPWNTHSVYLNLDKYLNENLRFWVTSEYWHDEQAMVQNSFRGAPLNPSGDTRHRSLGLGFLKAGSYYGDDDATHDTDNLRIELGAEASFEIFDNLWTGRLVTRYGETDYFRRTVVGGNYDFLDANGNVLGNQNNFTFETPGWVEIRTRGTFLNTVKDNKDPLGIFFDLTGDFQAGPTDNTFLTYVQYTQTNGFSGQVQYNMDPVFMVHPEDIDISVKYGQTTNLPSHITGLRKIVRSEDSDGEGFRFGLNDTMRILDGKLILLGGANYTHSGPGTRINKLNPANPIITTDSTNQDWTYKYSVVGKPTDWMSLFATHGETFTPMSGANILGESFRNRLFENEEIGVKFIYNEGLLTGTVSYFDASEDGFLTLEVQPDGTQVQRQNGVANFEGYEADVALNLGGFQGIFSVSKVDAMTDTGRFHRGGNQGLNWSFFTKYSFQGDVLKGFSVGASMRKETERIGDGNNSFWVPGYDVVDVLLAYRKDNWLVQLNVFNVFDEHYVLTAVNQNNVYFGDQLNGRLTFQYSF
jgi:iron complex outermembrane recepter protein